MTCAHYGWVRQQRKLTHVQRLVLCELVMRANGDAFCFPSLELLARDVEATERAVIRAIQFLQARGLIARITDATERAELLAKAGARAGTRANGYRILYHPGSREGELSSPSSHNKGELSSPSSPPEDPPGVNSVHPRPYTQFTHEGELSSPELYTEESSEDSKGSKQDPEAALPTTQAVVVPLTPPDIRKQLYDEGKAIIRRTTGRLNGEAGGLITKLLKEANQDCGIVLACLRAVEREGVPAEGVVGWVTEGIRSRREVKFRDPAEELAYRTGLTTPEKRAEWTPTRDYSGFLKEAANG